MAMKIMGDFDMVKREKNMEKESTLIEDIDTKVNAYLETQRTHIFTRVRWCRDG